MVKNVFKNLFLVFIYFAISIFMIKYSLQIFYKSAYPTLYSDYVNTFSSDCGVDKFLVYSVIRTESGFKHDALSTAQAKGLMQITKDTYEWAQNRKNIKHLMEHDTLYDPKTNIEFGTYILSLLLDEFQSTETAIAAYHAGWGNVKSWLKDKNLSSDGINLNDIPFPTTKKYVYKVMTTVYRYKKLYNV